MNNRFRIRPATPAVPRRAARVALPWAACLLAGAFGGAAYAAESGSAPAVPMPGSIDCSKPGREKEPVCNQKADPGIERVPSANADPGIAKVPPPTADGLAARAKNVPWIGRGDGSETDAGGSKKP